MQWTTGSGTHQLSVLLSVAGRHFLVAHGSGQQARGVDVQRPFCFTSPREQLLNQTFLSHTHTRIRAQVITQVISMTNTRYDVVHSLIKPSRLWHRASSTAVPSPGRRRTSPGPAWCSEADDRRPCWAPALCSSWYTCPSAGRQTQKSSRASFCSNSNLLIQS